MNISQNKINTIISKCREFINSEGANELEAAHVLVKMTLEIGQAICRKGNLEYKNLDKANEDYAQSSNLGQALILQAELMRNWLHTIDLIYQKERNDRKSKPKSKPRRKSKKL